MQKTQITDANCLNPKSNIQHFAHIDAHSNTSHFKIKIAKMEFDFNCPFIETSL